MGNPTYSSQNIWKSTLLIWKCFFFSHRCYINHECNIFSHIPRISRLCRKMLQTEALVHDWNSTSWNKMSWASPLQRILMKMATCFWHWHTIRIFLGLFSRKGHVKYHHLLFRVFHISLGASIPTFTLQKVELSETECLYPALLASRVIN